MTGVSCKAGTGLRLLACRGIFLFLCALIPPGTFAESVAGPIRQPVRLPIEVMGSAVTTVSATFTVPTGVNLSGSLQLWLQIHGLRQENQASVQVNGGAWTDIKGANVTLQGLAGPLGGIGGAFSTLKMTLPLKNGSIKSGGNTVTFRFNGTDGLSTGYRVLNFNVLDANGAQLVPASEFSEDDPSTWLAPLSPAADIQAGQALWKTAALTNPVSGSIKAHCGDCHTQDGRDLKYFNYSNHSIEVRSAFHGLSALQGQQIASYIRSLDAPAPAQARPWNPPYQPGPGLDSKPVTEWAAGAGLNAVLDSNEAMVQYLLPNGSDANWAPNAYLNVRELPIYLQLADWNHWLPTIHPVDFAGDTFTNSGINQLYLQARTELKPNDPVAYLNTYNNDLVFWGDRDMMLVNALTAPGGDPRWQDPAYTNGIYSIRLWEAVKNWELNQEFGLESMAQTIYGPQAATRAWSGSVFFTFNAIPQNAIGVANGTSVSMTYTHYHWYHLQLILDDGNRAPNHNPVDWGYGIAFAYNDLTHNGAIPLPSDGDLLTVWMIKAMQSESWTPWWVDPSFLVPHPARSNSWTDLSASQRIAIMQAYLSTWFAAANAFTAQQFYTGASTSVDVTLNPLQSFTTRLAVELPLFKAQGVDPLLLNEVVAWAEGLWPSYDWNGALNGSCTPTACTVPGGTVQF